MRIQTIILILVLAVLISVVGYGVHFVMDSLSNRASQGEGIFGDSQKTGKESDESGTKGNEISGEELASSGGETEESEEGASQQTAGEPSGSGEEPGAEEVSAPGSEQTPTEPEVPSWQEPEEPEASAPMEESEIPEEAFRITMTASGISPSSFEVDKGVKVVLSITSGDEWTHVFKFEDESLKDAVVGVAPNETRVITFYAPDEPGEYEFHCDLPGHTARGETGKMIVR